MRDLADDLGLSMLFDRSAPVVELKDAAEQTPPRARASVASLLSAARFELGPRATVNTERFVRSSGELDVLDSQRTSRGGITDAFDRPFFALLTDEVTGALLYAAYIRTW